MYFVLVEDLKQVRNFPQKEVLRSFISVKVEVPQCRNTTSEILHPKFHISKGTKVFAQIDVLKVEIVIMQNGQFHNNVHHIIGL